MASKAFILILLATAVFCYEQEGNVLVLHDDDFPKVLEQHEFIMIEFYAPWCGHCKKLAPIWAEVADQLQAQNSSIKMAKVDATVDSKSAAQYKVQGYPTLFFFHKGEAVDYKGQRTKEYLVNWLLKKTRDPLVPIDQAAYEKIQTEGKVAVVFHGDASSDQGKIVSKLAIADDFNAYYIAQVGKPEGSVQLFRPFDSVATYESADINLKAWITKNERPPVVPFDDRTIGDMFSSSKPGVCLFNKAGSQELLAAFTESAKNYLASGKELIFTHIEAQGEHLGPFADYIKTDPATMPIVIIEGKIKSKFVLAKNPAQVTVQDISKFLENWTNGEATKYGLTDEINADTEAEAEVAEQL